MRSRRNWHLIPGGGTSGARREIRKGEGRSRAGSAALEMGLHFTPGSLYSMVQLTLAPWVSSAVKGKVLGGRSGSMMLMTWGCGFLWQNCMLRGSGMGALSLMSDRTKSRVPVPVAAGEPRRKQKVCHMSQLRGNITFQLTVTLRQVPYYPCSPCPTTSSLSDKFIAYFVYND